MCPIRCGRKAGACRLSTPAISKCRRFRVRRGPIHQVPRPQEPADRPAGKSAPCQTVTSKPGTPASAMVGRSGRDGARRLPLTATARSWPAAIAGLLPENLIEDDALARGGIKYFDHDRLIFYGRHRAF